jgi:tRNA pseudouridine55 synthase
VTGILVLDKTAGVTSFDAVALVRRRLGLKRVGHAGTLDPEATGVLPILLGEATKLMPYLADQDKEYVATLRLGVTTDTGDLSGRVTATAPVPALGRDEVEAACRPFVGRIKQVPPMYSAVHHGGRRLYELAREGQEVVREPREVVIHTIEVEEVAGDSVRLRVVCGKGTYVRVLAADVGATLGCGAAVARLVRTRVGPFRVADALPWPALAEGPSTEVWARVLAADAALAGWPAVRLDARAAAQLEHGQMVSVAPPGAAAGTLVRVHAADGRLLGVGEVLTGGRTRPVRMLHADRPGTRVLPG